MAKAPKRPDEDRLAFLGRAGSLVCGFGLVVLGAVDATFDPFPGPETALFTADVGLIVIGITGRRKGGEE